eukprot:9016630-Pyramimonas_sp.AAC.1
MCEREPRVHVDQALLVSKLLKLMAHLRGGGTVGIFAKKSTRSVRLAKMRVEIASYNNMISRSSQPADHQAAFLEMLGSSVQSPSWVLLWSALSNNHIEETSNTYS